MEYKSPGLTVDCVVFDEQNRALLVRRKNPPFENYYALPGGFVEYGETTESAASRELREETGLTTSTFRLIGVYSRPDRNPGRHVITVAYLMTVQATDVHAGDDAATAAFIANWQSLSLAFDHNEILSDALKLRT